MERDLDWIKARILGRLRFYEKGALWLIYRREAQPVIETVRRMLAQKHTTLPGIGMVACALILWFDLATPEQLMAIISALAGAGLVAARDAGNGSDAVRKG